tara:strand:- start:132 stop:527 length:396 start_codon:yes stop_codon:yes gene_type:complete
MANILKELKGVIESNGLTIDNIKCADIKLDYSYDYANEEYYPKVEFIIYTYEDVKPALYDEHRADTILRMGEHDYDDGFGGQELYGTVWMDNGEWITRGEYDGSEWWDYHRVPEVPSKLMLNKVGNINIKE